MVQTMNTRLSEVKAYFDHGDTALGYRRLLDAALETQDYSIYEDTLAFCDWYDKHTGKEQENSLALNEQVNSLLDRIQQATNQITTPNLSPILKASQISKSYQSGAFKLSATDLELLPGQIVGLVGENGNGKTTLLRMLYGELKPDAGNLEYKLRQVPSNANFYDIKTRLAFIPQRPNAWYGSLMDNLQFTSAHYGFKGKENYLWTEMICARMGLRAFRDYTWSRISSGYKMRFELARTLLKKPEILLLDEPLANLDILAQQIILEDLRFLAQSRLMPLGIILSSQQLYEVEKVSQQVIFLKQGVPKYQRTHFTKEEEVPTLVIELETTASRQELEATFASLPLRSISFNGGVFLLYFEEGATINQLLRQVAASGITVKYFRDISSSSRRFFDS